MYRVREQIEYTDSIAKQYTGKGITVAVLDTGIAKHPDFAGRILDFRDFIKRKDSHYDDCGHGTHVCGILAGDGSVLHEKYKGIASKCNLVVGKVLDYKGDGNMEDMLAGMEWVYQMISVYQIRILNISIGLNDLKDETSKNLLVQKVEKLWNAGVSVIVAAGNKGPKPMSISPMGSSKMVITVGCNEGGYFGNRENLCENYSGRGPTADVIKKPDIVAPGTDIISCDFKCKKSHKGYKSAYIPKSGTSMATPIISGAAALYLEKNPSASNEEVKRRIIYTATDLKEPWTKQGWGMVNVKRMLE